MNPIEAMAKAIYESVNTREKWKDVTSIDREIAFIAARAAKDALADNVNKKMTRVFVDALGNGYSVQKCILGTIRAAGEE